MHGLFLYVFFNCLSVRGKGHGDPRSNAGLAVYGDRCRMLQRHMLYNGKPQTGSARLFRPAFVHTVEPLKNAFLLVFRNTDAGVGNHQNGLSVLKMRPHGHKSTGTVVTDRVVTKVKDQLFQKLALPVYRRGTPLYRNGDLRKEEQSSSFFMRIN